MFFPFFFLSHCKDSISVPFQTNTFRSFTQRRNLYLEEQRKVGVHVFSNHISCRPAHAIKSLLVSIFQMTCHCLASEKNQPLNVYLKKLTISVACEKNTSHIIPAFCLSLTAKRVGGGLYFRMPC